MKRNIIISIIIILILCISLISINNKKEKKEIETKELIATIIEKNNNTITVQDKNNIIYTFYYNDIDKQLHDNILIHYSGLLDNTSIFQDASILTIENLDNQNNTIPDTWQDNGIFKQYYQLAYEKLKTMTLDEKIGELLLVRYTTNSLNNIDKYHYGGYILYKTNFENKTEQEVKKMIKNLQDKSSIPLLIGVDEEGGSVTRVSDNPLLVSEKFKSPSELYESGGFDLIYQDTINKSNILYNLGINLNLAPVIDISTDPTSYIYERTLKQDKDKTSEYAKTVIEASQKTNVSYVLKHFPGYGNNTDTHTGLSISNKTLDELKEIDLLPFKSGIDNKAEAILMSHNIENAIDENNPISLSSQAHNLLRNDLSFTGIIITDDMSMNALNSIDNKIIAALLAGNDLIITSDYEHSFNEIKNSVENQTISEELINKLAFRVLSWKYYKNLIQDNSK